MGGWVVCGLNIFKTNLFVEPVISKTTHFFYRQLDFPSEPGVANEILENESENCLAVA